MTTKSLIERAEALGREFPDQQSTVCNLINAIRRIDRDFGGAEKRDLLREAGEALDRLRQNVEGSARTASALARLRETHEELAKVLTDLVALSTRRPPGATLH